MNIRQENGESKYEWVGKFVFKFVLFITCNYYEITNSRLKSAPEADVLGLLTVLNYFLYNRNCELWCWLCS